MFSVRLPLEEHTTWKRLRKQPLGKYVIGWISPVATRKKSAFSQLRQIDCDRHQLQEKNENIGLIHSSLNV